jgi:hypothetical protein
LTFSFTPIFAHTKPDFSINFISLKYNTDAGWQRYLKAKNYHSAPRQYSSNFEQSISASPIAKYGGQYSRFLATGSRAVAPHKHANFD